MRAKTSMSAGCPARRQAAVVLIASPKRKQVRSRGDDERPIIGERGDSGLGCLPRKNGLGTVGVWTRLDGFCCGGELGTGKVICLGDNEWEGKRLIGLISEKSRRMGLARAVWGFRGVSAIVGVVGTKICGGVANDLVGEEGETASASATNSSPTSF